MEKSNGESKHRMKLKVEKQSLGGFLPLIYVYIFQEKYFYRYNTLNQIHLDIDITILFLSEKLT